MENGLREAEEDYDAGKGSIGKLEEELTQLRRQKEQSGYLSTELKDKKTQLKIDLNSLKERLSVSFNVDIEELLEQENTPEGDANEHQASYEKSKHQLDNFGAINPMAMEAFDEMNERLQLNSQDKNVVIESKFDFIKIAID